MSDVPAEFEELAERVQGPVFTPGSSGYDDERSGFQTAFRHRPAVIVGATGPDDVSAAVTFAAARGLPVAVQATGHGLSAAAQGEGVLISTARMTDVRIDPLNRTVRIAAGVRWEQVIKEAATHGLAPLNGSAPHVGAVAYTLGGGVGVLGRQFGYTADHVRSIDVVTADGALRQVTADSDPDLFWALRGGRDNFGIVTSLEVALVPLTRIYGGGLYFDADLVPEALATYLRWTTTVPEELTSSISLMRYPDLPPIPAPLKGRYTAHIRVAYTGDADSGKQLVEPLRAIGPRLIDSIDEMPYTASGSIYNDPAFPHAYYGNNVMLGEAGPPVAEAVLDLAGPTAKAPCIVDLRHLGGAFSRPPAVPSAIGSREGEYILRVLTPLAICDVDTARPVHERLYEAVRPWTVGRNLNFIYADEATPDQTGLVYSPEDLRRLAGIKAVHDPANLFRFNHNIVPAAAKV
ncbi:FAD-binding oxidoreductase [Streptomyces sp. BH-SS-21]|uniref:FAD-binding oxidoreductase n=1 Tax=Streptomyces liliiviolaceus TaxID=2823109 RepID=A0A940Y4I9_9ACTN|nr:FAD-binding oxidoreductase [Streptomyces liliiviolaceus]MBQ0850479.1 FAD-binding oxidoreductase [Streptomyces liliiviolaceus]